MPEKNAYIFAGGINEIAHHRTYRAVCFLNTWVKETYLLGESTDLDNAIFSFSCEIFNRRVNLVREK